MARRKTLTDAGVLALKPKAARYAYADPELRGHYVRVQPSGVKSFVAVARDPAGKQIWATIGGTDRLEIKEARDRARKAIDRIVQGLPAFEEPPAKPDSFQDVARQWIKRHVIKNKLRSRPEIERLLNRHVFPRWGDRDFLTIKRSDIAALLDRVQDDHGARQADHVLAIVRGISNWFATRHDDYVSPFTRGMRRTDPKARKRDRILDDDELRAVWQAAEGNGRFGAIVRLALLTAQRREKIAAMKWADVADGTWNVPAEDREKGTGGALLLPAAALDVIKAQPRMSANPYVFAAAGKGPFSGFSKGKAELDKKLPPMPAWRFHDLRRTARSLMSRAGIRPDIAERVLGHVQQGVEGVYDRHQYAAEKADALARLAALIEGTSKNCPSPSPYESDSLIVRGVAAGRGGDDEPARFLRCGSAA
jgi:integrase